VKYKWFKLPVEEGWKPINIKCKFFKEDEDYYDYIEGLSNNAKDYAAVFLTFTNDGEPYRFELCFSMHNVSWMMMSHELLHLAYAYRRYFPKPAEVPNNEEWLCVIFGCFFGDFRDKFNNVFEFNKVKK